MIGGIVYGISAALATMRSANLSGWLLPLSVTILLPVLGTGLCLLANGSRVRTAGAAIAAAALVGGPIAIEFFLIDWGHSRG